MGFSGGGAGILTNHTHDTAVTNDGGALAANATMFGLSAGSVLFSDGSNIQELGVGSASDVLSVNGAATAPEWTTPAGGGIWEFVEEFVNASTQVYFTCTFVSAISLADYNVRVDWVVKNDAITAMELEVNNPSSYFVNGNPVSTGNLKLNTGTTVPADSWSIGSFVYYGNDVDNTRTMGMMDATSGDTAGSGETFGVRFNPTFVIDAATTEISNIRINPSSGNIYVNGYVRVYKMAVS